MTSKWHTYDTSEYVASRLYNRLANQNVENKKSRQAQSTQDALDGKLFYIEALALYATTWSC